MSKKKRSTYKSPEKHPIPKVPPEGFTLVNGIHGKHKVYTDGNRFITPDIDQHLGGWWKLAYKIKDLWKKDTRDGTYNKDLSIKLGA
ncbi:MAG: toxin C-terminal domain-containing protein [Clostridium saudiense]|uniref:toxin C-terminal domain-containing protein n=1 Tax=Clostridium saudiense TaxID=1414720 RepID=UPI0039944B16